MVEYFFNLTAGLEAFDKILRGYSDSFQFIRIQSTKLEKNQLEDILIDLDSNFLMKLATGKECVVFDYTSRKQKDNTSRACWKGLEWIRYCLNRVWFKRHIKCRFGMHAYFEEQFKELNGRTLRKLKYFKKFVSVDNINLSYICKPTNHDNDDNYYIHIVKKFIK